MNSDNTLLAGRTLDYGPYGWMEVGGLVTLLLHTSFLFFEACYLVC